MLGSDLHRAALEWAARGIPVFPCVPGTKRPATPHGFLDATLDPSVIGEWWAADEWNVGISPGDADLTVLDVDPKNGGDESLNALELCYEVPGTFTVSTPSGGTHRYYRGATPRSTAGRLGVGLDTRSRGGYVLVPPSATDAGAYTVSRDTAIAPTPDWLPAALVPQRNISAAPEVDQDLPRHVEQFRTFMASRKPALAGTVNDTGTKYVGVAADMGLTRDTAWPIMVDEWGARCTPPFGLDDKLYDCGLWTQRQNEGHPLASPGLGSELFTPPPEDPKEKAFKRFYLWTVDELSDRPEPLWIVDDIIRERAIGHVFGDSQTYKSYVMLRLAMELSLTQPVVYVVGEGEDIIAPRARALEALLGTEHRLRIVTDMPQIADVKDVEAFVATVQASELEPALIILDTLSTSMGGLDETKDVDMRRFIAAMKYVRDSLRCAVCAIHHVGQAIKDRERGSYVLRADVDFVGHFESGAKLASKLTMKKQRGAEMREHPFFFVGKPVGHQVAFQPATAAEYDKLVDKKDPLPPSLIGTLLAEHGITEEAKAVTTDVLATWVRGPIADEPPEVTERALNELSKELRKRAKRPLAGYVNDAEGSRLRWWTTLPDLPGEPAPF